VNQGSNGGRAGIDLHLTNTWNKYRGKGVAIAIVDDGIDTTHPDLAAHIDSSLGYDWNEHDSDPTAHPLRGDYHGTECAGAAAAIRAADIINRANFICGVLSWPYSDRI